MRKPAKQTVQTNREIHLVRLEASDAVNEAIEIFNRRWSLRILWELRKATRTFRELQIACGGISPSVLNERLGELRAALLVQHEPALGYELTQHGKKLIIAARPLLRWAPDWAEAMRQSGKAVARPRRTST